MYVYIVNILEIKKNVQNMYNNTLYNNIESLIADIARAYLKENICVYKSRDYCFTQTRTCTLENVMGNRHWTG